MNDFPFKFYSVDIPFTVEELTMSMEEVMRRWQAENERKIRALMACDSFFPSLKGKAE